MPPNGRAAERRAPGAYARRVGERRFSREAQGEVGGSRVPFLFVAFLGQTNKKRPRVQGRGHPQLAVEIACKARDTIQDLDARVRGHDRKTKAAFRRLLVIHYLDLRFRGDDNQQGVRPSTSSGRTAEGITLGNSTLPRSRDHSRCSARQRCAWSWRYRCAGFRCGRDNRESRHR
jgi:hypothetical protein